MKVAQYEVLGMKQKGCPSRNGRSKHSAFGLAHGAAIVSIRRSSRSSFVPPSLRYGAAFSLRARCSSKSEGGILTMADKPGRIPLLRTRTQHFVLGYFRQVPTGLIFSNHQRTRALP
jgi:hypothetical protein